MSMKSTDIYVATVTVLHVLTTSNLHQCMLKSLSRDHLRGKYHCTVDLLFDWFGISCMTTDNFCFYLQNRLIQTGQKGGQLYSDTPPFSVPCFIRLNHELRLGLVSGFKWRQTEFNYRQCNKHFSALLMFRRIKLERLSQSSILRLVLYLWARTESFMRSTLRADS